MDVRFDGTSALITGGSRGIGFAIAQRLAESGANVLLVSRKAASLEAAARSLAGLDGHVSWLDAHVGNEADATRAVAVCLERYGRLDALVNNAGTNPHFGRLVDITESQMLKTYEVNQASRLFWTKAAVHAWMEEHGGAVLNISSIGGLQPEPGLGWYNVTKAADAHLTRQLAYELGPNVRVNCLAPGLVKTDLARALWESFGDQIAANLPLRRLGEPEDIANLAAFVLSAQASWLTGQVIAIDGGTSVLPSGGVG